MQAMRGIVKTFRRPPTGRIRDRNGGLPRLSDGVAHALRCPASPQRTLLAENLGMPSLWVMISAPWYECVAFDAMAGTIVVEKEMAITHADFLRTLPRALDGREHTVDGNRIVVEDGPRRLEITLSETTERRIALLTLPVTRVRLEYRGYTEAEAAAAVALFDRAYRRGGG